MKPLVDEQCLLVLLLVAEWRLICLLGNWPSGVRETVNAWEDRHGHRLALGRKPLLSEVIAELLLKMLVTWLSWTSVHLESQYGTRKVLKIELTWAPSNWDLYKKWLAMADYVFPSVHIYINGPCCQIVYYNNNLFMRLYVHFTYFRFV